MKAVWTPVVGEVATLGDDKAAPRRSIKLERLGGTAVEQLEPLAFSNVAFRSLRGNLSGDCVFNVRGSHPSRDAAALYFKGEYARIGQKGELVLTVDSAGLTLSGATLRGVTVTDFNGVEWTISYTFGIGLIT